VAGPGVYRVRLWLVDAAGKGGPHHAAQRTVTVAPASSPPPGPSTGSSQVRTRISATLRGRRLRVAGTLAADGRVRVSWRAKRGRRTLGHGSRVVVVREHRLAVTFALSARARGGVTRVVVRRGARVVAHARARRA